VVQVVKALQVAPRCVQRFSAHRIPQSNRADPPTKQAKGGNSTLRPVTIVQILQAAQPHPDADFAIEGVDLGSVSGHRLEGLNLALTKTVNRR
jgi:hypothetical protein